MTTTNYTPSQNVDVSVSIRINAGCGWSNWTSLNFFTDNTETSLCPPQGGCGGQICAFAFPNPTLDVLNIGFEEDDIIKLSSRDQQEFEYQIDIADFFGQKIYSRLHKEKKVEIDFKSYKNGYYFVTVRRRDEKQTFTIKKE